MPDEIDAAMAWASACQAVEVGADPLEVLQDYATAVAAEARTAALGEAAGVCQREVEAQQAILQRFGDDEGHTRPEGIAYANKQEGAKHCRDAIRALAGPPAARVGAAARRLAEAVLEAHDGSGSAVEIDDRWYAQICVPLEALAAYRQSRTPGADEGGATG